MPHRLFVAVVVLALCVASPVFAQDAHVGTWKQNFEKSKLPASTNPRPQSVTRIYEMFGDGLKMTVVTVTADGKTTTTNAYSARFDGKDYPATAPNFDTIALKKIDNYSFENVNKKGGKVISTGTNVVSKDGKTMTFTSKGVNASGQSSQAVLVFEKQ